MRQKKNQKELCKKYFLFLDEDFGPPPSKIKLILSDEARKHPPSLGGLYQLGEGLTNEKNYWVHRSGHSAIWWNHNSYFWCVGVFAKLGSTFAGIVGPFHESNWPSTLTKGWKYSNTQDWKKAGPEDIQFEDWSLNEGEIYEK